MGDSWTKLVAQISVETGISPVALLDCPPHLFEAIVEYLRERADAQKRRTR